MWPAARTTSTRTCILHWTYILVFAEVDTLLVVLRRLDMENGADLTFLVQRRLVNSHCLYDIYKLLMHTQDENASFMESLANLDRFYHKFASFDYLFLPPANNCNSNTVRESIIVVYLASCVRSWKSSSTAGLLFAFLPALLCEH